MSEGSGGLAATSSIAEVLADLQATSAWQENVYKQLSCSIPS